MKTKINAQIVAHSVNEQGDELISVLATFPRIILAEVNTHRMLSKNTSSSRAIPFHKMVETIQNDPFIPIAWQKEHKGMQGSEYFENTMLQQELWLEARNSAVDLADRLNSGCGVTKQLCNRLLEPFMWTTMLITGPKSGWDNFFHLRCPQYNIGEGKFYKSKKDALKDVQNRGIDTETAEMFTITDFDWLKANKGQAEIHMMALAECIWDAVSESTPKVLKAGKWHIPFEDKMQDIGLGEGMHVQSLSAQQHTKNQRKVKVSVAMAARTSYTVVGEEKEINYEAMIGLHDRLLAWDPPHSSPLEHCAQAMTNEEYWSSFGTTAQNTKGNGWCNNLKGFIPYRYMVDNGTK
jgi:thymidylate synthase ThyX